MKLMLTTNLNTLPLAEGWCDTNPEMRSQTAFPFFAGMGTKSSAAVYIVLDSGKAIGRHTDSAEETVLVLEGVVEVMINGERAQLGVGEMAVVPAMEPHNLRNIGTGTARLVGFFGSANNRATFEEVYQPEGLSVFDTSMF
jgi:quercetin dioxygenase-like cupin family protein